MLNNIISSKLMNKTFLVCHNGNNYNLIKKLAIVGSNVCILNPLSRDKDNRYKSVKIANEICDFTKRNNVTTLECNYQDIGDIKNTLNEIEDIYQNIDGLVLYKEMIWDKKLLMNKFIFHHDRHANIFITDPELYKS